MKKSEEEGQQSRKKDRGERIKAEGNNPNSKVVAKIKRRENIH